VKAQTGHWPRIIFWWGFQGYTIRYSKRAPLKPILPKNLGPPKTSPQEGWFWEKLGWGFPGAFFSQTPLEVKNLYNNFAGGWTPRNVEKDFIKGVLKGFNLPPAKFLGGK